MAYIGEKIPFARAGETLEAIFQGVTERGEIVLMKNGEECRYAYGEISMAKLATKPAKAER